MNILITGASKGIGFETALELSKNRDNHIIAISRDAARLETLRETAAKKGGSIDIYKADISSFDDDDLEQVLRKYDRIDILINNAGLLINKPFLETSIDDWKEIFESNLFGVIRLVKVLFPYLAKSDQAHIVNIGSMGGFQGTSKFDGLSAYSASKAALGNLTECLANEFSQHNIKVNCLALGAINTEMLNSAFPGYQAPIESHEIAGFISYFCLNASKFFNGKIIPVSVSTP